MLNTLNINLKTDIKNDRPTALGIKLMSQDKNNNQFILRFTNGGEPVTLDDTYSVEILTKFTNSGASRLTSATVRQDYATWQFDTEYITQDEMVYNYVYVRKAGSLVVSADANAFYFDVGLSEIDKNAGRVAEVYDENYQKYLDGFKDNVDFEEIAQAESDRQANEDIRQANELLREENYNQKVDTAIVEADVVSKVDNKVTELTPQINNLTAQLAQKATKQALEVEKARFNTLASLTDGSTTGDAELIDARVGADGLTYSSAGHAIREQLSNLRDGTEIINLLTGEWLDSTTLSNHNIYTTTANSRYSGNGVTDVSEYVGNTMTLRMDADYVSSCIIGLNNTSGNFLSRTTYSTSIAETVDITVPEGAKTLRFVVLSSSPDSSLSARDNVSLTVANNTIGISEIREKTALIEEVSINANKLENHLFPIKTKEIELSNGTYNPSTGQYSNTSLSLINNEPIKLESLISLTFSEEMNLFIREFDDKGEYIGAATYGGISFRTTTTSAMAKSDWVFNDNTDTLTLVISTDRLEPTEITPYDVSVALTYRSDRTASLEEQMVKVSHVSKPNYAYAMNSVLCIGDSFTSGAYFGSTDIWASRGTSIDQNYPRVLGRMLNTKVVNAGMSGIDSTNWYATEYDKFIDDTGEDETKWYDTFVIWLGANGGYSDTFTSDIEQHGTNYTQYADTAVGNLGKIIQRIKENHTNRLIVILNLFGEPNPSGKSNEVISQVSDFFNIPLIDMSDLDTRTRLDLHYGQSFDGHSNPHFNKAGNVFIADRIVKKVNEHLSEDVTRADFGLTARSN